MKFFRNLLEGIWKGVVLFFLLIFIALALGYPVWGDDLLGFPFPWRSCHDPYNYDAMNPDRCWPLLMIADLVFWIAVVYVIFRPWGKHKQHV